VRTAAPKRRKPHSSIIQFYSSYNNIGNLLPVLGIREMIADIPDTYCMHNRKIDFDFINANYRCAIIGGAGLFHACFNRFWKLLAERCRLPMIMWGVGVCFPDAKGRVGVDRRTVAEVARRCDLVNVRDDLTAEFYGLDKAHISPCPTLAYLRRFHTVLGMDKPVLFVSHKELTPADEIAAVRQVLTRAAPNYQYTTNAQSRFLGLHDILTRYYCRSSLVVTTRLHGAIIAYGLGIPYLALARDEKLRAFCRRYGNGLAVETVEELQHALTRHSAITVRPIRMDSVLEFGGRANAWLRSFAADPRRGDQPPMESQPQGTRPTCT
jgi:hypothetical protein